MTEDPDRRASHHPWAIATVSVLAAGIVGEVMLEFIAWVIAPPLLGRPMEPALLIQALFKNFLRLDVEKTTSFVAHLIAGVIVFPAGYVVFREVLRFKGWLTAGLLWGGVLWLLAQAVLAPLAGRPFMLGFIPYTWASLVAHAAYATTVAFVVERLSGNTGVGAPSDGIDRNVIRESSPRWWG